MKFFKFKKEIEKLHIIQLTRFKSIYCQKRGEGLESTRILNIKILGMKTLMT